MIARSAAIVVKDKKILLIYRRKAGQVYYVVPGGGVEAGETPEAAAIRELMEETSVKATANKLYKKLVLNEQIEYFWFCDYLSGVPAIGNGPELQRQSEDNFYRPQWVAVQDLGKTPLLPPEIKESLMDYFAGTKDA